MSSTAQDAPRLRMFAGPNGSGKSTIKDLVAKINPDWLGVFINPDEIEAEIKATGFLDLGNFDITVQPEEALAFFRNSTFLINVGLAAETEKLGFRDNRFDFSEAGVNSYFASVAADFIRQKLIRAGKSFSFETVMSSRDKLELLDKARGNGYRTYLYYVATDDPLINISRVEQRVKAGGHDVPKDKIESRYYRSLDWLLDAVKLTNRAYIFDNSGEESVFIAEITDGSDIEIHQEDVPAWFENFVLDRI
jgi:predicted ABC-type ATPase